MFDITMTCSLKIAIHLHIMLWFFGLCWNSWTFWRHFVVNNALVRITFRALCNTRLYWLDITSHVRGYDFIQFSRTCQNDIIEKKIRNNALIFLKFFILMNSDILKEIYTYAINKFKRFAYKIHKLFCLFLRLNFSTNIRISRARSPCLVTRK